MTDFITVFAKMGSNDAVYPRNTLDMLIISPVGLWARLFLCK